MENKKYIREKAAKVARGILDGCILIVGVITILPCLLWFGFLVLTSLLYNPAQDVTSPACQDLARGVLSACNIGERSLKKVHHGYKTMAIFPGDHFGAYAIEISYLDVSALTPERGWTRGDQVSGELENAINNILGVYGSKNVKWFPKEREVKSADVFVYSLPWKTFSVVLIRPSDKMVFYAYFQT